MVITAKIKYSFFIQILIILSCPPNLCHPFSVFVLTKYFLRFVITSVISRELKRLPITLTEQQSALPGSFV